MLGHHDLICTAAELWYTVLQCCSAVKLAEVCGIAEGAHAVLGKAISLHRVWPVTLNCAIRAEWAPGSPVIQILLRNLMYNGFTKNRNPKLDFKILNDDKHFATHDLLCMWWKGNFLDVLNNKHGVIRSSHLRVINPVLRIILILLFEFIECRISKDFS